MKTFGKTAVLFIFAVSLAPNASAGDLTPPELQLKAWQAQPNLAFEPAPGRLTLVLELDVPVVVNLEENRELLATAPEGAKTNRFLGNHQFFSGRIDGNNDSWARVNSINGELSGAVFDGENLWLLDQAEALGLQRSTENSEASIVAFQLSDLEFPALVDQCGQPRNIATQAKTSGFGTFASHLGHVMAVAEFPEMSMPVTVVTDTAFSEAHPDEELARVLARINFVDGLYSEQLDIGIRLWHHEILDEQENEDLNQLLPEPGVDSEIGSLLTGFMQYMGEQGPGSHIPFRGLAHLFTGQTMNPVGTSRQVFNQPTALCNRAEGYGVESGPLPESAAGLLFAHQLGHNFNAPHDDNQGSGDPFQCPQGTNPGIMRSTLLSTSQTFSTCSNFYITQEITNPLRLENPESCLVKTEFLFSDSFESGF